MIHSRSTPPATLSIQHVHVGPPIHNLEDLQSGSLLSSMPWTCIHWEGPHIWHLCDFTASTGHSPHAGIPIHGSNLPHMMSLAHSGCHMSCPTCSCLHTHSWRPPNKMHTATPICLVVEDPCASCKYIHKGLHSQHQQNGLNLAIKYIVLHWLQLSQEI